MKESHDRVFTEQIIEYPVVLLTREGLINMILPFAPSQTSTYKSEIMSVELLQIKHINITVSSIDNGHSICLRVLLPPD